MSSEAFWFFVRGCGAALVAMLTACVVGTMAGDAFGGIYVNVRRLLGRGRR